MILCGGLMGFDKRGKEAVVGRPLKRYLGRNRGGWIRARYFDT